MTPKQLLAAALAAHPDGVLVEDMRSLVTETRRAGRARSSSDLRARVPDGVVKSLRGAPGAAQVDVLLVVVPRSLRKAIEDPSPIIQPGELVLPG